MKALVFNEYGSPDVLHLESVEKPSPKPNEILIKVYAASVGFGDLLVRNFKAISPRAFSMPALLWLPAKISFGFRKPKIRILGGEFSGEIEAIGTAVTRFKPGDHVFGYRGQNMGANAEYLCIPEDTLLTTKPSNMSHAEAATVPYGALTALSLLRKMNIQPGQKVLINGASGGIGSYAIQIAKYFGAEVTGVCGTPRLAMVKALGADHVIDYTQEDFTQNGQTYDLIMDIQGKLSFDDCKRSLKPNGKLFYTGFKFKQIRQMIWTSRFGSRKVICALSGEALEDLNFTRELIEMRKLKTVVDRCFPIEQAADAHRYAESGQRTGHVVLILAQ